MVGSSTGLGRGPADGRDTDWLHSAEYNHHCGYAEFKAFNHPEFGPRLNVLFQGSTMASERTRSSEGRTRR